jgi:hypothetical protein
MDLADIDHDFWQNHLEVPVAATLAPLATPLGVAAWVEELSPACCKLLARRLGVAPQALRKTAPRFHHLLAELALVDAAVAGKRASSLDELGSAVLTPEQLDAARRGRGMDRRALGWLLFEAARANLPRLHLLDRIHRRGSARLVMASRPTGSRRLDPGAVHAIVSAAAARRGVRDFDLRVESLVTRDHHLVFFRWPLKTGFVVQGAGNVFGFERDWIAIAFSHDLWRARVASKAPSLAAEMAEEIAGALLGAPAGYVNETAPISIAAAERFLERLLADPHRMPIVEMDLRTATSMVKVNHPANQSVAADVRRMQATFGADIARVRNVGGLKVLAQGKRVRLIFEHLADDSVVVRYADQVLAPGERDAFEQRMRVEWNVPVVSAEKRHVA